MKENMRAVVYREKGVFALEERTIPKTTPPEFSLWVHKRMYFC